MKTFELKNAGTALKSARGAEGFVTYAVAATAWRVSTTAAFAARTARAVTGGWLRQS